MPYQNPEHPFFNAEIKPALVVINILLGLLLPFTLIIGLGLLVAKPLQLLFSAQATWYQTVVVMVAGVGLPGSIAWSLFATWRYYRRANYHRAFWASLAPVIFGAAMLVLFGLVYIIDTIVLLFR
ncbi:MAG: hypothetical protein MUC97_09005 [Bernardetiaceae bacterium]|jgi:hypothetical protein|nr:hypothetical protein [Bernardetiaceae bacterium]